MSKFQGLPAGGRMARLTGRALAEAIAAHRNCRNYGALVAMRVHGWHEAGRLSGDDLAQFQRDRDAIDYVVISYATPIAWVARGTVYRVAEKFGVTSSKHAGALYLLQGAPL